MLREQPQDRGAGADLDVVGVGADDEEVERSGRSEGQATHPGHAGSAACQTAQGGRPGVERVLEGLDVLERVHRRPVALVRVALELAGLDQPG